MTGEQVLVLSTRTHRFAAQMVTRAGVLRSIAPPHGVALQIHGAGADRDLASTGRYAIATWAARTGTQASMYHHA
jgi:predicted alpha/beta-hydrolase family hydrolase